MCTKLSMCVQSLYAKFEYKRMKLFELHIAKSRHLLALSMGIKCLCSTSLKISNVKKIGGAHPQCVNNHYATFEYIGMKCFGVPDYTNQTPSKHF